MLGKPLHFDFDANPPAPDWVIEGFLERGTLTVLSGASGAGKSFVAASMSVALIQGREWIKHGTNGKRRRVLYIDGENHPREMRWRYHALGMTNEDRERMRYFLRAGVQIGEGDWTNKIHKEIESYEPDLVCLDTAASVIAMKSGNDNTEVAKIMGEIRGLCDDCAVVLLNHERKQPPGTARDGGGSAMLGGVQWQAQADQHLSLYVERVGHVEQKRSGDTLKRRYPMKLEMPKNRKGEGRMIDVVILSEHQLDGTPIRTALYKADTA